MLQFEILGRIYSKKNNKQIFYKNGKMIVIPSKKYKASLEYIIPQLNIQKNQQKLENPISDRVELHCTFYIKGRESDYDNLAASVGDILQDVGILQNDRLITTAYINKVPKSQSNKTVLTIKKIKIDDEPKRSSKQAKGKAKVLCV